MMRTIAFLGLAAAFALAMAATAVLIDPGRPATPAAIEHVAEPPPVAQLDLPGDVLARPVAPLVPAAARATLVDGTRLRIPRLGIDLPLRLGDEARDVGAQATPNGAAFLLPSGAVPGATPGNAYIYAHARAGLFLRLWDAQLGDKVDVVGPSGDVLHYVVIEIHPRVAPSDLRFVGRTADERLTLQTSTGPNASDPRFVVVARLTK